MKLIVNVDEQWGIGLNNKLLFPIPEDLAFFKNVTTGKVVVMGHSTLKSLPDSLPLKNRINIILTKNETLKIKGAITCNSVKLLSCVLSMCHPDDVYVIGGLSIYSQLLDYCDEAYVTKVFSVSPADAFFPNMDKLNNWELVEQSDTKTFNDIGFCFCRYINKAPLKFVL